MIFDISNLVFSFLWFFELDKEIKPHIKFSDYIFISFSIIDNTQKVSKVINYYQRRSIIVYCLQYCYYILFFQGWLRIDYLVCRLY